MKCSPWIFGVVLAAAFGAGVLTLPGKILGTYNQAKLDGSFSAPQNLEKMRRGQSPVIITGPNAGASVDVDHLVSFSRAPEMDNRFGNLRYLPRSQNIARSNKSDQTLIDKLNEYLQRGHFEEKCKSEILNYRLN